MNRTSAFFEGNSEAQVHRPPKCCNLKSGVVSCCMCWSTLTKSSHTWGKFSTNLIHNVITHWPTPFCLVATGNFVVKPGIDKGNLPLRNGIPFLDRVLEMGAPTSFLGSKRRYHPIYLVLSHSKLLVHVKYKTIYLARACRAKPMRPWRPSWDRLPMALLIRWSHLPVMTWMDIAFAHQATSRVSPIEKPQVLEFLRPAKIGSSIMEDLKKYTNSAFMVAGLLILLYSNAIGLILQ